MRLFSSSIPLSFAVFFCGGSVFFLSGCATHEPSITACASASYSECFQPLKNDLNNGLTDQIRAKLDDIDAQMQVKHQYDDNFAKSMGMLNLLEMSTLYLHTGGVDQSLNYSRYAECLVEKRNNDSLLWEDLRKGVSFVSPVIGAENYSVYDPVGYEKVLLLNIQAMDYLLKGDDRAFNVARKSTDWQEEEREKFEEQLEKLKTRPQQRNGEDEGDGTDVFPEKRQRNQEIKNEIFARLAREFAQYDRRAVKVPSAFVNPFGDYLAGVAMEFRGTGGDPLKSMYDNARIQYKNALELNPGSRVLKLAHKDMQKRRSADRLVQIVAFDGFVPEKRVFSFDVHFKQCPVPIHLEVPVYEPVKTRVDRIVAATTGGQVLATFRPVADVEALALRQQKDMLPAIQALVAVAAIRDTALQGGKISIIEWINKQFHNKDINDALQELLGGLMGVLDRNLQPDTSSWMSLPKRIMAARFHPPKHLKTIVISSYDRKGRRLVRRKVKLDSSGRHFIFVRTLDKQMKVIPGKKIWSPKERTKRIDC